MAVIEKAKEVRSLDTRMKKQIRWGFKDLEIYTKIKVSDDPLKKVNLKDFMNGTPLPEYDTTVKWKDKRNLRMRKELKFGLKHVGLPSLRQNTDDLQLGAIGR